MRVIIEQEDQRTLYSLLTHVSSRLQGRGDRRAMERLRTKASGGNLKKGEAVFILGLIDRTLETAKDGAAPAEVVASLGRIKTALITRLDEVVHGTNDVS